jgi:hypothetical protein
MTVSDLNPDLDHARQFLALLDSDPASFTFQVIPERTGSNAAPKFLHGSVDTLADQLVAANQAGAGIFFMVNAGDQRGRRAENVQRVRAHFVDLDTPGVDPLFTAELSPHIVVESSAGSGTPIGLRRPERCLRSFPHCSVRWRNALRAIRRSATCRASCGFPASSIKRKTARLS